MQAGSFPEFRDTLAWHESRGRYDVVNRLGYLGKYQFGAARLIDLGLMTADRKWIPGLNRQKFLASKELQEAAFTAHVARLIALVDLRFKAHFGRLIDGTRVTASGLVAACHLVGPGSVNVMLRDDTRPKDANGTTALKYLCHMGGFSIPRDLPTRIPREVIDKAIS